MDCFDLLLSAFTLIGQGWVHLRLLCRLSGRRRRVRHLIAYLLLLWALDRGAAACEIPYEAMMGAETALLYGLGRLAIGSGRRTACVAAVTGVYITQLAFGMVNSVEAVLFPRLVGRAVLYPMVVIATLAAFALCVGCSAAVERLLSLREEEEGGFDADVLLLPELFFLAAELYILRTAYSEVPSLLSPGEAGRHATLLLLQAMGLGALLCTLYACRCLRRGFQAQAGLLSLVQAARAQRTYVAEAEARYRQTAAFRHDVRNHLIVLRGLLSSGQVAEGRAYLERIEAASAALSLPVRTGNPVVDILLGEKLRTAEDRGIRTEVSLILPAACGADNFDLCVIFANALDNALAACPAGEGTIRIGGEQQGDFCLLSFENTCSPGPLAPAGTGLANIRRAAEKYRGTMRTEKRGEWFRLDVLLNISLPSEDRSEQSG